MAVLEGGKGPKVKYTRKACGHPSVTGPKLQSNSPSHCLRALPRPILSQGPHFLLAQKQGAWDHRSPSRPKSPTSLSPGISTLPHRGLCPPFLLHASLFLSSL